MVGRIYLANSEPSASLLTEQQPVDVDLRWDESESCHADMQSIASRLLACLFYIEVLTAPEFYAVPERVRL